MIAHVTPRADRSSASWRALHEQIAAVYPAMREWSFEVEYALHELHDELVAGSWTYLYVVQDETGPLKIGVANDPIARTANLQVGNPRPLLLFACCPGTAALERFLHRQIAAERIQGEWFAPSSRSLTIAGLIAAAEEQCADMEASGYGRTTIANTIGCLTSFVDEVLVDLQRRVA